MTRTLVLQAVLLITGLILMIDCALLIAADKINFGTVVPFFIGLIFALHAIFWRRIQALLSRHRWLKHISRMLWIGFGMWLVSFIIFAITLQSNIQKSHTPLQKVDAIIVLGGGIQNGIPSPTLANRLDSAAVLIKQQPQAMVITSGGVGIGETRSEAEAMAQYLYALQHVPLQHVLQEDRSTSTEENFLFSQTILLQHGVSLSDPIAIVTSDFHIPRAKAIAQHQGYENLVTLASPTPLSIRYNAWFREYFAYISGWLLGEY
ncbi:YdcF family protein [Psychrobacter sp. FDAARGOS_221]|nr:YdcF family protein [Psychrobacter sp. FDAARGOS_221]